MSTPAIHKSFAIERTYRTSTYRVYRAPSDPQDKRRRFGSSRGARGRRPVA